MPSTKEYLEYILEQLSDLDALSHRAMMGEYILYLNGKVVGGVYDDRLLVKPTEGARRLLPEAPMELPYPSGKPMLLVTEIDDRDLLADLVQTVAADLGV